MPLTRVTAPTVNPVTDAQVWDQLRVTLLGSPAAPADQTHIAAVTAAAVACLDGKDGWLGRALVTQTWDLTLDRFPCARNSETGYRGLQAAADAILLPLPPLQSVTYVKYVDTAGVLQTLDGSLYTVDTASEPARLMPAYGQSWPATRDQANAVTIRFVCGYAGDGASPEDLRANVPAPLKWAVLLLAEDMYQFRGDAVTGISVAEAPITVQRLIAPYRVWHLEGN